MAVGGDFEVMGKIEFELLRMLGLRPDWTVVDVGCGSGRLAAQLPVYLKGRYVGTEILPELLEHAKRLCKRPDWEFYITDGQTIPVNNEVADIVCFFSVFTHISQEETYRYVLESMRILKPGGKLVCSFLEFKIRSHWHIFREGLKDQRPNKVLDLYSSRDQYEAFAFNSGLEIEAFYDGDRNYIPIEGELTFANGNKASGLATLGQSVCVMRKPLIARVVPK